MSETFEEFNAADWCETTGAVKVEWNVADPEHGEGVVEIWTEWENGHRHGIRLSPGEMRDAVAGQEVQAMGQFSVRELLVGFAENVRLETAESGEVPGLTA